MREIRKFISLSILVVISTSAFSQITVSNVETKVGQDIIAEKPEPYDSLKSWEILDSPIKYKKYIGQKVYLPTRDKNLSFSKSEDISKTLKMGAESERPFLFMFNSKTSVFDTENVLNNEMLNIDYNNSSSNFHTILNIKSITTNIYQPYLYSLGVNFNQDRYDFTIGNNKNVCNRYYQIIDIIYDEKLKKTMYSNSAYSNMQNVGLINYTLSLISKKKTIEEHSKPLELNRERVSVAYVLKDEILGDTVIYCKQEQNRFILVSYFVKMREIYEAKYLINESSFSQIGNVKLVSGSKWLCKSVTVSASTGVLTYVLENAQGDIITLNDIKGFILEEIVLKEKAEEKMLAQEKEEMQKKEQLKERENERIKFENRKKECIARFGQEQGLLIANGKVQLGMTKEMCEIAWNKPIMINKTTNENGVSEIWYFGFIKTLYFKNGILKSIEE